MLRQLSGLIFVLGLLAEAAFPQNGPSFDNSGNSLLQGSYFVRQVLTDNLTSSGTIGRSRSLTGVLSFDGNGNYSFSGQLSDNTQSSGAPSSYSFQGTYIVSSSGLLQMQNPVAPSEPMFGGLGVSALVASSAESNVWDLLIAVPLTGNSGQSSLQGTYRFAGLDYTNGDVTQVRDYTFVATADGQGSLGSPSVSGAAANLASTPTTQTVSNASYSAGSGQFTFTFPAPGGGTAQSQLIIGNKQFGLSSDGNVLVGGSLNGYDMIVGIKPVAAASNASFSGIFYAGGLDDDASKQSSNKNYLDAYYGSIHANGAGTALAHERVNPSNDVTYDYSFDDEFRLGSSGSVAESADLFFVGSNGQTGLLTGQQSLYSLEFWVAAQTVAQPASVSLNPLGVTSVASFDPITNPVAPGQFVALYGNNLASSTTTATSLPLPAALGTTSVSIDGIPAPIYSVSPGEVIILVPWEVSQDTYAQIVVTNNGIASNAVTVYLNDTAPGMFTTGQNGIGAGSITHANGSLVTEANPAKPGETVIAYAAGLGTVTPLPQDGVAASANPLGVTDSVVDIYIGGVETPSVTFAGLAPGYAGLYQINFVVPPGAKPGDAYCDIATDSGYISQAVIAVGSGSGAQPAPEAGSLSARRVSTRADHPIADRSSALLSSRARQARFQLNRVASE